jgi:hypothetical protein
MLSVLLLSMGNLSENRGWLVNRGLHLVPWWQQYIWGYYWGINIMLTVGFGDFIATDYE